MCPICIATAAWVAAGVGSTSVFFSLAIKLPRRGRRKADRSESATGASRAAMLPSSAKRRPADEDREAPMPEHRILTRKKSKL